MSKMICVGSIPVKSTRRKPVAANHRFGIGILASHPHVSLPFSAADSAEVAQMSFDHEDSAQDVAGELLNTLVPAIEAIGAEVEDGSVSETGLTVNVCGKRVRIEFIPMLAPICGGSGPTDREIDEMYEHARWLSYVEAMHRHVEDELL